MGDTMTTITIEVPDDLARRLGPVRDRLPQVLELGLQEVVPLSTQAYMEALEFLAEEPSPEEIVAYHPSADVQARLRTLLDKNQEGLLTHAEAAELDRLSHLEHLMILLKARARQQLAFS